MHDSSIVQAIAAFKEKYAWDARLVGEYGGDNNLTPRDNILPDLAPTSDSYLEDFARAQQAKAQQDSEGY